MLNGCGERKANIDLGAGDGSDYDLPDQTNTLDVYCIGCLALRSHIQSANYTHSTESKEGTLFSMSQRISLLHLYSSQDNL